MVFSHTVLGSFCRSQSLKSDDDDSLGEFGLSEDYDYEVDDNVDKFKTLNDKTILYFIENYRPDKNNSELVHRPSKVESEYSNHLNTKHLNTGFI